MADVKMKTIMRDGIWDNNVVFAQMLALCPLLAVTSTATIVTLVDMSMNAWMHEMHKVLGLFIPLIVTNCAILGRVESFASHQPVGKAVADGFFMGIGFTIALVAVAVGATREMLGSGTLFANAPLLLGDTFAFMELTLIPEHGGFLLMILPPGAFIALGFILAGKRVIDARLNSNDEDELVTINVPAAEQSH